jgi:hypothetical protein
MFVNKQTCLVGVAFVLLSVARHFHFQIYLRSPETASQKREREANGEPAKCNNVHVCFAPPPSPINVNQIMPVLM